MNQIPSDIEIARGAKLKPISQIAQKLNIDLDNLHAFGPSIAKIPLEYLNSLPSNESSKLILVTAISPTPAGEGKTTTTIGLGDAISRLGKKSIIALREPSLGPVFGMKGGAAGGGYSQVLPMEEINLHFTGDFHAITAANNLLAALIDNHIHWGNELEIDARRVVWRRALDMNDRALRNIVCALGGAPNGFVREDGFDITVASEIMAIFCLVQNFDELEEALGNLIVAYRRDKTPVYAHELSAPGALCVLLKNALNPNLVQTIEGTAAFVHGGPFANIAHGCNSIIATKAALKLADYVVTEAGFGSDLGAEKFMNIKCRKANIAPNAVVLVATIRALKMHGGVAKAQLNIENLDSLRRGFVNLQRHFENISKFGIAPIIAINHFASDTPQEIETLISLCQTNNMDVHICDHFTKGGEGALNLAKAVIDACDNTQEFKPLYSLEMPLIQKIETIAKEIYRAESVDFSQEALTKLTNFAQMGYSNLPVCIAKTQYSFSNDAGLLGAPVGFSLKVRDVRLSAGAGFVVIICGDIMTMPGLPKVPAANNIRLNENGEIIGLF